MLVIAARQAAVSRVSVFDIDAACAAPAAGRQSTTAKMPLRLFFAMLVNWKVGTTAPPEWRGGGYSLRL